MIISDTQTQILSLLGRFKFLVISQMIPLLNKSTGYIRQQLASLVAYGYIKSHQLSRPGKAENMYYLTESGKELIIQHGKMFDTDIKLVVGVPLFVNDFSHRRSMISCTISLYNHLSKCGITIADFFSYFDKQGENRKTGTLEAKTKIPLGNGFFIPDGIMLTKNGEQRTIYIIEMYCDVSTTRPLQQLLEKHVLCIAQGTPAAKFEIRANPFVLSAFENDNVRKKVIEKLSANTVFQPFAELFFFATLEEVIKDCGNAWHDIQNNQLVFT